MMTKKEKKKRAFESQAFILPPLKMILTETEQPDPPARKKKLKPEEQDREEIVMRLIARLSKKD